MAANTKTANEAIEDIEILRFLDKGYDVQMVPVSGSSIAVDTEQDLKKVKELIKNWQS
jgi:3-deoxy-manno-octulosonate cytidylyltransferase (CMP-KDO synthetase)